MVGDKNTDIECGRDFGIRTVRVLGGNDTFLNSTADFTLKRLK